MAKTYITIKCPYCNKVIHRHETSCDDYSKDIGHPTLKCFFCEKEFWTGQNYWNELSSSKKNTAILKLISNLTYRPICYALGIGILILITLELTSGSSQTHSSSFSFMEIFTATAISYIIIIPIFAYHHLRKFKRLCQIRKINY